MRNSNNKATYMVLFAIGLLSDTQVNIVGWVGISEVFCFVMGPIFFWSDMNELRRNGFLPFIYLTFFCFASGVVSNLYNHIPLFVALKGLAAPYAIFAIASTLHHYLYRDLKGLKWLLVGIAISMTASAFVFQQGNTRVSGGEVLEGSEAVDAAVGYSLFWAAQLGNWLCLPIRVWYLQTSTIYSVAAMGFVAAFGFITSNSRSSMIGLVPVVLLFMGRKKIRTMKFLHKYFWLCVGAGLLFLPIASATYKYTARMGYLGEEAQKKYVAQTRKGTDMMSILLSGRGSTFAGLLVAMERPFVGHGSWARDFKGYYETYLRRFGDEEELRRYYRKQERGMAMLIPAHSWVISFWLWNGIGGLVLMLYMGWLLVDCLKNRLHVIPEWYGYFVITIPGALWAWMFSPFGGRIPTTLLFVLCLFARAVSKGKYRRYLPPREAL